MEPGTKKKLDVEGLIARINIVDYIGQYVSLKEHRKGDWWGCSPFTGEKTPSFQISEQKQVYHDFSGGEGGGTGGNVFTFVKNYFHCGGYEAVNRLLDYAGLTQEDMCGQDYRNSVKYVARKYKTEPLPESEKRTVIPPEYMNRFGEDEDKLDIWRAEGIGDEALKKFGVRYDRSSNRLVYPIKDNDGDIISISGRTLCPDYKEKGLRKYTYFHPLGRVDFIYGLSDNQEEVDRRKEIILFEGAKSVMKAYTWGFRNTGALLTCHLNREQMMLLAKGGWDTVFALDKEVVPWEDSNIKMLCRFTPVYYIRDMKGLLGNKDAPVDKGEKVFRELYEDRKPMY